MPRAAIFGGSFNPPHLGHLLAARAAIASAALDRLYWVPTRRPPHKSASELAPLAQRAYMLRLALADDPVSQIVCEPAASSGYAWDTFLFLRDRDPDCQWSWLLGLDAFTRLPYWYQRQELIPAVTWLVAPRPIDPPGSIEAAATGGVPAPAPQAPSQPEAFAQTLARLRDRGIPIVARLLSMPTIDLAATALRARYAAAPHGNNGDPWVPAAVDRYIRQTGLYRQTD